MNHSQTSKSNIKMDRSVLKEKPSFNLSWPSLPNLIWVLRWSLLPELPPRKLVPYFVLWSFFLLRLLCYKSTIRPCVEYCCHVWAGAPSCYFFRQAIKMNMQDCWSFTCYFSWPFGSSSKCGQLKCFLL